MLRLLRMLALCLWPMGTLCAHEILLVGGDDTVGVSSFVSALQARRPLDQVRFQTVTQLPSPGRLDVQTRLILLDEAALDWRLREPSGPLSLALRISRVQAQLRLGKSRPEYLSLLWSDPPLARQLRLTRYLLPQARRIGVLYGPDSRFLIDELHQAANHMGLEIVAQDWADLRDSRPLQHVLGNSDVLLGIDDPQLFNAKTVKNLLLSSYGRQMALIGPNAGFRRPGQHLQRPGRLAGGTRSLARPAALALAAQPLSRSLPGQRQSAGGPRPWAGAHRAERSRAGPGRRRVDTMSKRLSWDIHARTQIISLGPALLLTLLLIGFFTFVRLQDLRQELDHTGQLIANQLAPACEYGRLRIRGDLGQQ